MALYLSWPAIKSEKWKLIINDRYWTCTLFQRPFQRDLWNLYIICSHTNCNKKCDTALHSAFLAWSIFLISGFKTWKNSNYHRLPGEAINQLPLATWKLTPVRLSNLHAPNKRTTGKQNANVISPVSQIWALIVFPSTCILLVANSTPIVDLDSKLNSFLVNRDSRFDFPTPESPIRTTIRNEPQH